ncbi:SEC62 protein, partial [Polyodon spathula]|nr:SEC62 protein [Polyodon spathula]
LQEVGEPTKEEKAVAKYFRFNCPTKSTNMMGHRVDYFIASKAVDCLLDSKWAKAKKGEEALFTTRESVVDYCNRLLKKQFFHRALKVMKKKPEKELKNEKEKEKEKEKSKTDSSKEEEKKNKKEVAKEEKSKKEKDKKKEAEVAETKKEKSDESPETPKKKKETKKKFKLEPHEEQIFLDGNEVYVWIYDPVHVKTFAMGLILVIAVITATLFPLWPAEMRVGVYYLSVAAGCFVASILLLAVARCILFLIIWVLSGGRHHFWFLPNLTADVGFIDSFRPLYTHEYKGPRSDSKKPIDDKAEDAVKPRKSDSEEKSANEKKEMEATGEGEDEEGKAPGSLAAGGSAGERQSDTDSDRREDDGSQHSNGNDFEMITREELEQHTDEGDVEEEGEYEEEEEEDDETKPLPKKT